MSVLGKKWIVRNKSKNLNTFEKILENRGISDINNEMSFHDPFLFKSMEKVVNRIGEAIKNSERIIIFGDYDVDGITGTVILVHILKILEAKVSCRIPNRVNDGYGLSEKFIDQFIEKQVKLIITVDCGISCKKEVVKANKHKIHTIITDHHTIPKNVPEAFAIIHPKFDDNYPFDELTGAGVAFKLAHALIERFIPTEDEKEKILNKITDLACLGTIADLGPIIGENKSIVKKGIEVFSKTEWMGLQKLKNLASIKENQDIDSSTIGYKITPRINAAGRIGDPYIALLLLLEEENNDKVQNLGQKLEELNLKRQNMTVEYLEKAENLFNINEKSPPILITENDNWHIGVLGLVAGRLAEKYVRPTIIMQDLGDMLVASARSPKFFNIIEAISECKEHLLSFGGHAQAAGFNIKKDELENFKKKITNYAEKKLKNIEFKSTIEIDCEINDQEINFEFLKELDRLRPFGVANEKPIFLLNKLEPYLIEQIGKDKNHLRFTINFNGNSVKVIAFNMGEYADTIRRHRKIDLVFNLEKNSWKDKDYLQLKALDFRTREE